MSVVSGNYFDLGGFSMGIWMSTITFELSAPATHDQADKSLVSSARTHSAIVDSATGEWAMPIISTEGMRQDRYYTVMGTSLDSELGMPRVDYFPWKIRIPEGIWKFTDLVRDWSSPLAVSITSGIPEQKTAYVLDPFTGELFRKKA
ncbi:hypothetical protein [Cryobacterium sp. Y11]|uniref:hypothetical protein n=1 Tax=Cryobacterium sp. Y11 TaxID=2045016 RepID=UPI000CE3BB81|nr:hypothetical protein [Cryobacterium sp. Y11]